MMNENTRGPWIMAAKPSRVVGWPVVAQSGRVICSINYVQHSAIDPKVEGVVAFNRESKANARLIAAAPELLEALQAIVDWLPKPFDFPADWHEQIEACEDCRRYQGHPIQQGICDTHRRPLWDREKHDAHQERYRGYALQTIARAAIAKATDQGGEG